MNVENTCERKHITTTVYCADDEHGAPPPPSTSIMIEWPTHEDFIDNLTNVQKNLIRSLEHLYKKLIKANFAVTFNETCLNENKLPVYTNVKPHDPAVRQQSFLKAFHKRHVEHQIETKKNVIKELDQEIRRLETKLSGN